MLRILGLILFVSWISYPILILSGASHETTYMIMSLLYITVGAMFIGGLLPLVQHFMYFHEKGINEFPPGFARTVARIIFGIVGIYRSKIEWICIAVFGGIVFLVLGIALFFLATDRMSTFKYLIHFFR